MNHKLGLIAASLIVCAVAGPARADLSASGAASPNGAAGAQNAVFTLLDKYASESVPNVSNPVPEASMISALTKIGTPMNDYYSILGSNDQRVIASTSASPAYSMTSGGGQSANAFAASSGSSLAALAQWGVPVGSGAVVSGESVAPLSGMSSSPIVSNTSYSGGFTPPTEPPPSVPIPLPFFLTGSGLIALLCLKKRGLEHKPACLT